MEKGNQVRDAVKAIFTERRYVSVSAGEVAKRAGVSKNTAKKYLRLIVEESIGVYDFAVELKNGLVMTCYAFDNRGFED